jgi:hypothetical protein
MTDSLFVITGGGTGAKIAEPLVHLCAAGLGPKTLHLLLIDSDTSNGNVQRTTRTVEVYQEMHQWPWDIDARVSRGWFFNKKTEDKGLHLFSTEIHLHTITDEISTVLEGGLETAVETEEMHRVLDLLYDQSEQGATCEDGFRARPNLGCLLLADHLNQMLPKKGKEFLDALRGAVSAGQQRVPIAVAASVFGGTGASLIPVIRGCVEQTLTNENVKEALDWSVVKMLPHYQPAEKKESVDPDRFFLDTSSSLRFYSTTFKSDDDNQHYDAMYAIGSDNPGRNRVKTVLGHSDQANPSYFEEVIGALAILHRTEAQNNDKPMYLYDPPRLHWDTIPYRDREKFKSNLAYLLHLSAFYLQGITEETRNELDRGFARFLDTVPDDSLVAYPWFQTLLAPWADNHPTFKNADPNRRVSVLKNKAQMGGQSFEALQSKAAEYFGRVLLWADTSLHDEGLKFVDRADGSYAYVYEIMSDVAPDEIDTTRANGTAQSIPFNQDNALARSLRAALVALVRTHTLASEEGARNEGTALVDNDVIRMQTTLAQIKDTLYAFSLGNVIEEYTRTRI